MQIFGFLGGFLGYILWGIFYVIQNFGLSIVLFTLIIKLLLFPFSIKQQKSMAGTARLSKKQQAIREQYANNSQKAQEELNKLYEKEGVKPMGGCLTTIIPLIVILGVFYAVAYPLTNTLHLNSDSVQQAINYVNTIPGYVTNANPTYQQVSLLNVFPNIMNTDTIQGLFSSSEIAQIQMFENGFSTFGVDLLAIPSDYGFLSGYILFPVLCFLSNVGSQIIMQKINGNQMNQQMGCMKVMLFCLAFVLCLYRIHCSGSRCLLLDYFGTFKPCSVDCTRQSVQSGKSYSKLRGKTRCVALSKRSSRSVCLCST